MADAESIKLSLYAMATRFELILHGADEARLRAAGEEALGEIERLDAQLSLYRGESDISWINARAATEPFRLDPRLFRLLQRAARISLATDGAFDVTIAPLMRAWGLAGGTGRVPDESEIKAAMAITGMRHVHLDEEVFTATFDHPGVAIDLGAIGKGYAIECAVESLVENGVTSALLHGGTSSISAIGAPPDADAWRVAVRNPIDETVLETVDLRDSSLSVSAVHGKSFSDGERVYGHVIEPRTGRPVRHTLVASVTGPLATECDALSTALLVLGESGLPLLAQRLPGYSGQVLSAE